MNQTRRNHIKKKAEELYRKVTRFIDDHNLEFAPYYTLGDFISDLKNGSIVVKKADRGNPITRWSSLNDLFTAVDAELRVPTDGWGGSHHQGEKKNEELEKRDLAFWKKRYETVVDFALLAEGVEAIALLEQFSREIDTYIDEATANKKLVEEQVETYRKERCNE